MACARGEGERYRFCGNAEHDVCNWLVVARSLRFFARPAPQPHHPRSHQSRISCIGARSNTPSIACFTPCCAAAAADNQIRGSQRSGV